MLREDLANLDCLTFTVSRAEGLFLCSPKVPKKHLFVVPEGIKDHDCSGGADTGDGGLVVLAILIQ